MNCEAGSLYPHRERLNEVDFKTCFNDYHDLMVAARIGKGRRYQANCWISHR